MGAGFKRIAPRNTAKQLGFLPKGKEVTMPDETLLAGMLEVAVPLWIEELNGKPWEYIQERAKECSQVVAEKGDIILFKSKKKGESAEAFNRMAEGVACLAFAPGGVDVFGLHFEAKLQGKSENDDSMQDKGE